MYLPGTASLLEELDKRLMVLLRDGRTLIGYLRSVDQFANLVLHRCIERIHVGNQFGDIPRSVTIWLSKLLKSLYDFCIWVADLPKQQLQWHQLTM